jgi:hypothetical protein
LCPSILASYTKNLKTIMLRAAVMGTDEPQPDDKYDELVERLHAPGRNFHQRRARQTLLPKEEILCRRGGGTVSVLTPPPKA